MKIYAKQVPPEYQESPLFRPECFPDNIAIFGNREYKSHIPEYVRRTWDALYNGYLIDAWDDINHHGDGYYYNWKSALVMLVPPEGRGEYTREERAKTWPDIARRFENARPQKYYDILCDALRILTGKEWSYKQIAGSCQSDWNYIFYPAAEWDAAAIEILETEYFNTGTEWIIHDENDAPESPDDINGYSVYCHDWNDDGIKREIAEAAGGDPGDVILYKFTGWTRSASYTKS